MLLDPHPSPSLPLPLSVDRSHSTSPPPPLHPHHSDLLDDIFSSSRSPSPQTSQPPSPSPPQNQNPTHYQDFTHPPRPTHPSDIPRLRATHSTAGYREGLSAAKTTALQPGFDEGYTLGAVLGLKVGELLGVLGGLCGALRSELLRTAQRTKGDEGKGAGGGSGDGKCQVGGSEHGNGEGSGKADQKAEGEKREGRQRKHDAIEKLLSLHQLATSDLSLNKIFAPELWDGDGIWKWDVPPLLTPTPTTAVEGEDEITFTVVVAAHPAIKKWTTIVEEVVTEWGVQRGVFGGEEWEAGRVGV